MPRKVSIISLFILAMLAGNLTPFLSARVTPVEQPYQVAVTKRNVNALIRKLEKRMDDRIKLLETEVEKLKKELEALKKNLPTYKTEDK